MKAHGDIESINLRTGERRRRVVGDGESRLVSCGRIDDIRFGPREPTESEILERAERFGREVEEFIRRRETAMHYRNGREAKNGDKVVKLDDSGKVVAFGVLHSAVPGNDYCNGNIAVVQAPNDYACMVDCLHVDDVAEVLKEKSLDKRPAGK